MRRTVNLDPDVEAAVVALRRERSIGLSEAVNELARAGAHRGWPHSAFVQRSAEIRLKIDVSNVAEVLEVLEGSTAR